MKTIDGRRSAVFTAVAGTVFIAAGAFWLSFTSLADLARRSGIDQQQAWAWPLIVDGIIVVATVAVVALAGSRSAWYPWALLIGGASVSITANALHAVVAADADVPSVLAASVAAVPPVVLLAITHLTVTLTRSIHSLDVSTKLSTVVADRESEPGRQLLNGSPRVSHPTRISSSTKTNNPEGIPPMSDRLRTHHDFPPHSGPPRRETATRLSSSGWSNKRIARELGVHPSTVGRWFAAEHLPDKPADGEELNP